MGRKQAEGRETAEVIMEKRWEDEGEEGENETDEGWERGEG